MLIHKIKKIVQDVFNHARASLGSVFILSQPHISVDARSLKIWKIFSIFYFRLSIENENDFSYMKRYHNTKMNNWFIFLRCSTVVWIGPAFSISLKIFYIIWPPELTQLSIVMIFLLCFAWVLTYRSFYYQPWHCMWVHLSV